MTSAMIPVLVAAASELIGSSKKANADPTYNQIVRKAFEDSPVVPPTSAIMTASRAAAMGRQLRSDGHQVVPVTQEYYSKYKGKPSTLAEYKECLPYGRAAKGKGGGAVGRKAIGIRHVTQDDPVGLGLWGLWWEHSTDRAAGAANRSIDSISGAVEGGEIPEDIGNQVMGPMRMLAMRALTDLRSSEVKEAA